MPYSGIHRNTCRQGAAATLCLLLFFLFLPAACAPIDGSPFPSSIAVRPDPAFNQQFTRYGDGWTGGDGTLSIQLPGGRTVWLFGDTFLGRVRPDESRPVDSPLIRNCLVLQDGQALVTHYGGTMDEPQAFLAAEEPDVWYWPGDGTLQGERLRVFFHRFRQVAPGMWGWAWDGTVLATINLPDLVLAQVSPRPEDNGVAYGASILEKPPWLYIFGTRQRGAIKYLHLARAPQNDLDGQWVYWTGQSWSTRATASQAILSGVSNQFGVLPLDEGFGLVTMDARQPFTGQVVAYFAAEPTGPWQGPVPIYQAPEANDQVAAYNPVVHPQFSTRDDHLVSYNINHLHDPDMLYENAALYRPRFIRVNLNDLARSTTIRDP